MSCFLLIHVYLARPFVLSLSRLEAIAPGSVLIGSDAVPFREVIVEGVNALLVDFSTVRRLCKKPAVF